MAAPNIIGATTVLGKILGTALSSTSATSILNNAASSGKCLKVNTVLVSNYSASAATIIISLYSAASLGGTAYKIAGTITVPAYSTLTVIDKSTQIYLDEDKSLGATAGTSNAFDVVVSYEEIS